MLAAVIDFLADRPRLAATVSALSLLDMANCIRLGHTDWIVPAVVAFGLACLVRENPPAGPG